MSDTISKYFENADASRNVSVQKSDKIVQNVVRKYNNRSAVGIEKYKTTLEDSPEDLLAFVKHLQEELMDASLYCETIIHKIENGK